MIFKLPLPERAANLCLGADGWLYLTVTTSPYRVRPNA